MGEKNLEALTAETYKDFMSLFRDFMNKSGAMDAMIKNCSPEEFKFVQDSLKLADKFIDLEVERAKQLDDINQKLNKLLEKK